MRVVFENSKAKNKRYRAILYNTDTNKKIKTINFGHPKYENYTIHKDDERKNNYITRHKKREDWNNLKTAGTYSRYILWNKKSLSASISDFAKRFNVSVKNNIS